MMTTTVKLGDAVRTESGRHCTAVGVFFRHSPLYPTWTTIGSLKFDYMEHEVGASAADIAAQVKTDVERDWAAFDGREFQIEVYNSSRHGEKRTIHTHAPCATLSFII